MFRLSFEFIVEGVLLFIVASIGVLANMVAIFLFLQKKEHTFYR